MGVSQLDHLRGLERNAATVQLADQGRLLSGHCLGPLSLATMGALATAAE